jgi:hypothetical protein
MYNSKKSPVTVACRFLPLESVYRTGDSLVTVFGDMKLYANGLIETNNFCKSTTYVLVTVPESPGKSPIFDF